MFLLALRYREGQLLDSGGNQPVLLAGSENVWIVYRGVADVFSVQLIDGEVVGPRRHLFRAQSGLALFGLDVAQNGRSGSELGLLAVGTQGTQLLEIRREALQKLAQSAEDAPFVADLLEGWVANLTGGTVSAIAPKDSKPLETGKEMALAQGQSAFSPRGVIWIKPNEGSAFFAGRETLPLANALYFPLSSPTWVYAAERTRLHGIDSEEILSQDPNWAGLDAYNDLARRWIGESIERETEQERQHLAQQSREERLTLENSVSRLAEVVERRPTQFPPSSGMEDPLLIACRIVGSAMGVTIIPPSLDRRGTRPRPGPTNWTKSPGHRDCACGRSGWKASGGGATTVPFWHTPQMAIARWRWCRFRLAPMRLMTPWHTRRPRSRNRWRLGSIHMPICFTAHCLNVPCEHETCSSWAYWATRRTSGQFS